MPKFHGNVPITNLKEYLDGTKLIHNSQGYEQFAFYVFYKVPINAISRMFFVNSKTAKKWHEILRDENDGR